ncbi:hypothetical protein EST38_g3920 [Candolleomyces aberdarensis]|uniref:AB hydrolase-1 domain-containing protein n=1 Tax=Candolleomyces aberdarensis TaxID=2316362 RepID=A0A4Q2DR66_9AGAR|nr:hypothetical protein EST38_g3920 [Candolleomyces aberdarensis]
MSLSSVSRALLRARPTPSFRRLAQLASVTSSANASAPSQPDVSGPSPLGQPHFPCVDAHKARESRLTASRRDPEKEQEPGTGPEPSYARPNPTTYHVYHHSEPFPLAYYPKPLPSFDIAYETWGTLSPQKDNVILLHTGLSASSHAASTPLNSAPGWWEKFIGPGKPLDTNTHFIICTNVIGGCYGSTGPSSIEPETGKPWATRFPVVSIFDMVKAQFHLLDHLGVKKLYASVGCSMGAMQSLAAGWLFPSRVGKIVSISGTARSSPSAVAMRFAQRSVLMADPNWNNGFYYDGVPPHTGMKLARQIATITYRSGPEWDLRFGRQLRPAPQSADAGNGVRTPALCPDFLIETYLDHQGEQFCLKYDANSLLYVSKAMDLFDMTAPALKELRLSPSYPTTDFHPDPVVESVLPHKTSHSKSHPPPVNPPPHLNDLAEGLKPLSQIPTLVLGVQSDILFTVEQQRETDARASSIEVKIRKLDAELARYKDQMSKLRNGPGKDAIQQRALRTLKQKRMYEAQVAQLTQQSFNMESTAMATDNLRNTMASLDAMTQANKEIKKQYGKIDIDKIEDMHYDMEDMLERANEIQETLGRSYAVPDEIDEADLEAELDALALEQEEEGPSYLADLNKVPDFIDEPPVEVGETPERHEAIKTTAG